MAFGLTQGGVESYPVVPGGYDDWATLTSMAPGHPLVGGSAGLPAYGGGQRSVAVGAPDPTQAVAGGAPPAAHWTQLFNLRGNPIGWVAIIALLYLGVTSIHVRAGVSGRLGR